MNEKKPNILFFLADQHRYDCTGYANRYPVKTPNIDRIAAQGACFDAAFTPTPVCAPARQTLLSGRRAEEIGALWNFNFIETKTIQPTDFTFPAALAENGYHNIFIGHWDASTKPPEEFGFHEVYSYHDFLHEQQETYGKIDWKNSWFGETSPIPPQDARPGKYAQYACDAIARLQAEGKPWCIWVDAVDPHLPCRPSQPFADMFSPEDTVRWDGFGDTFENKPYIQRRQLYNWGLENRTWEQWSETVARYYAMIAQVDAAFGQICDTVDTLGCTDDTMIIYTADHGDMCGSHGMIDKHYVLYDDVLRVPLVMRYPRRIAPGTRIENFVHSCLDMAPTILDLCGLDIPDSVRGYSLFPLLEQGSDARRKDFAVSAASGQQFGLYTQRCIRTRTHKYVWNLTDVDELYDLTKDPGELHNLIHEPGNEELLQTLRADMTRELRRCGDPFLKSSWLDRQLSGELEP